MFRVMVNTGAEVQHQIGKEIAPLSARKVLQTNIRVEGVKATNSWWKSRVDWKEAEKNRVSYEKNFNRTCPETLVPEAKNWMWRRAKQLKDQIIVGMLSKEEVHPTKTFTDNGRVMVTVDEEKMNRMKSVERNAAWYRRNDALIREFKNIMRHLCPDDPSATDIERFRPRTGRRA